MPTRPSLTLLGNKSYQNAAASPSPRRFLCAAKLSAIRYQPSGISHQVECEMRDFHGLIVWQKSHVLTLKVYQVTRRFPKDERFGLISKLRRSASSVPANLAEGCGRGSEQDFARFVQIAMGSSTEVEYHVLLTKDLGYVSDNDFIELTDSVHEVKRMLTSLLKSVREQIRS